MVSTVPSVPSFALLAEKRTVEEMMPFVQPESKEDLAPTEIGLVPPLIVPIRVVYLLGMVCI